MLNISRGVEHVPEAERDVESYKDFDQKQNGLSLGLLKISTPKPKKKPKAWA